jgi:hypothetical protein
MFTKATIALAVILDITSSAMAAKKNRHPGAPAAAAVAQPNSATPKLRRDMGPLWRALGLAPPIASPSGGVIFYPAINIFALACCLNR